MKVSITDKNENALLKRTEPSFTVEDATVPPARKELREKIAALQNVKPEQVIVAKIGHGFGSKKIEGKARIYGSVEDLEKTELEYIIGRNKGEKKKVKKKEEKPAEGKEEREKPAAGKDMEKTEEKAVGGKEEASEGGKPEKPAEISGENQPKEKKKEKAEGKKEGE